MCVCLGGGGVGCVCPRREGFVCASVCSHCPKVFPVATSVPLPSPWSPLRPPGLPAFGAHRILPHPLVRAGEGDWGHSKEAGLKPSPGLLPNILLPESPPKRFNHGQLPVPQFWGGPGSPLLVPPLPLFFFFHLCLFLPQPRHIEAHLLPLRRGDSQHPWCLCHSHTDLWGLSWAVPAGWTGPSALFSPQVVNRFPITRPAPTHPHSFQGSPGRW